MVTLKDKSTKELNHEEKEAPKRAYLPFIKGATYKIRRAQRKKNYIKHCSSHTRKSIIFSDRHILIKEKIPLYTLGV